MAAPYGSTFSASAAAQARKAEGFMDGVIKNGCFPTFEDAGKYLEREDMQDKVKVVRDALKDILTVEADLKLHVQALNNIGNTHQVNVNAPTDFKKLIDAKKEQLRSTQPYDVEQDQNLKNFDSALWSVKHAGEARDLDEDEELVVAADEQPSVNAACPMTQKPVLELSEPVEDAKGYVYEKSAILQYIKQQGRGTAQCPVAGTNHVITANQLKPARAVMKAKRLGKTSRRPANNPDALEVD